MKYGGIILVLLAGIALAIRASGSEVILNGASAQVCFSPGGGCTKEIVNKIEGASRQVLVQAYSFTSSPIRKALIDARRRGLKVAVILDPGEQKEQQFKTADILSKSGVSVYIDDRHSCAHDKVIIIDEETVITGSFNFTYGAENNNAENLLVVTSTALAGIYGSNWTTHQRHSSAR